MRALKSATDRVWACHFRDDIQFEMDVNMNAPHVFSGHRIVSNIAIENAGRGDLLMRILRIAESATDRVLACRLREDLQNNTLEVTRC